MASEPSGKYLKSSGCSSWNFIHSWSEIGWYSPLIQIYSPYLFFSAFEFACRGYTLWVTTWFLLRWLFLWSFLGRPRGLPVLIDYWDRSDEESSEKLMISKIKGVLYFLVNCKSDWPSDKMISTWAPNWIIASTALYFLLLTAYKIGDSC